MLHLDCIWHNLSAAETADVARQERARTDDPWLLSELREAPAQDPESLI